MKRASALLALIVMMAGLVVACTPKPVQAGPVAQDFLAAFAARDGEAISSLVDDPAPALAAIEATWGGLQAEALELSEPEITQEENWATATYDAVWRLPRDRELSYRTQLMLTQTGGEWTVRWQPTIVHPQLGANQHLELRPVVPEKASVVSSDGAELMKPGAVHRLLVDTDSLADTDTGAVTRAIAGALARAHERDETVRTVDPRELEDALAGASGRYSVTTINALQAPAVAEELAAHPEIILNEEAAMITTDPGFAPDLMARVGPLVADRLDGTAGWQVALVNRNGAALGRVAYTPPEPAAAIHVSIDRAAQIAAEEAVETLPDGAQGVLMAMRPSTGEILAVAQTPAADAEGNLALMGQYPPGSIFKIVTAAAGVELQGMDTGDIVGCPGSQDIFGRVVINYQGFSLGNTSLENAFAQSCNTTFADMSTRLEPGQLKDVGKSMGLGIDYDIPGLDTMTGSVPVGETPLERTEAGYGQGYDLASPFGFTLVSSTVAAGQRPTPYLIEGEVTTASENPDGPAPETIDRVRRMMRSVVTSGTARGMSAAGEIHGKTGEAEVNDGSHAWFTGFRDDLAFTTLVVYGGGSTISVLATDRFLNRLDELKAGPAPAADAQP